MSFRKAVCVILLAIAGVAGGAYIHLKKTEIGEALVRFIKPKAVLTKERLASMLGESPAFYRFPTEMEIPGFASKVVLQYSFDQKLQQEMESLFEQYKPDYGAFVAMDAETGRILSVVSFSTHSDVDDNLAFRATFPSASVFKVVTAAAAIEDEKYSGDTLIAFNGANHTLYKHNILKNPINRWTRKITLKEAFSKSINTVFGRIGAFSVGSSHLREYADRFGFNHPIQADFNFQEGRAPIPDDAWGLSQTASGYTQDNTMSPMQGALIAAAIGNGGKMMEPFLVKSVYSVDGKELYTAEPKVAELSVDSNTAAEIQGLMRETVLHGTSMKSFHGFNKGKFADVVVGGKTGTLTGSDPRGRYDWFVSFANGRGHKIALAALTVHQKFWRVKSSYLVRRAIEEYFGSLDVDAEDSAEPKAVSPSASRGRRVAGK